MICTPEPPLGTYRRHEAGAAAHAPSRRTGPPVCISTMYGVKALALANTERESVTGAVMAYSRATRPPREAGRQSFAVSESFTVVPDVRGCDAQSETTRRTGTRTALLSPAAASTRVSSYTPGARSWGINVTCIESRPLTARPPVGLTVTHGAGVA